MLHKCQRNATTANFMNKYVFLMLYVLCTPMYIRVNSNNKCEKELRICFNESTRCDKSNENSESFISFLITDYTSFFQTKSL